jgi:hypothetical protein
VTMCLSEPSHSRGRWFERASPTNEDIPCNHVGLSEAVCFGLSRPNRGVLQVGHRHGILWQDCYGGVFADPF